MAETTLRRANPATYGPEYRSHLLDQYKLYMELIDRVSQRRATANNWLLSVNAFLVTLYGFRPEGDVPTVWRLAIPLAGILVSVAWWLLIRSYRALNRIKCDLVHEIEEHLPLGLFSREWDLADEGRGRTYRPLTSIEQWIPGVFVLLYIALIAFGG
jgi:hypothetical protein